MPFQLFPFTDVQSTAPGGHIAHSREFWRHDHSADYRLRRSLHLSCLRRYSGYSGYSGIAQGETRIEKYILNKFTLYTTETRYDRPSVGAVSLRSVSLRSRNGCVLRWRCTTFFSEVTSIWELKTSPKNCFGEK